MPDYPKLAQLWWQNVGRGGHRREDPAGGHGQSGQAAGRRPGPAGAAEIGGDCAPKLNPERDAQYWLDQPGAPAPKLADERGKPETLDYDRLIAQWKKAG